MKCLFHRSDLDGQCSGAIVRSVHPEVELIGIDYGEEPPWESIEAGEMVFMVDFSLPMEQMERLNGLCRLVWVDHHKTAIEAARARGFLASGAQLLEIGRAGCELTWALLRAGEPLPRAVLLLGRYDVWDHHNYPGALEFQYGMRNEDCGPENQGCWQELFRSQETVMDIILAGGYLLRYEERQNERYARELAFEVELDGLRCIALNRGLSSSLLFASVYDAQRHDAMLAFSRWPAGWKVSLYADKPGVDVSAICKARGGGGHKGAAGFSCAVLPF